MSSRAYFLLSGGIFGVVGLAHLFRAVLGLPVQAGPWVVPQWLSWIGGAAAFALCGWALALARGGRRRS